MVSAWTTTPPASAELGERGRPLGLVLAGLTGGEGTAPGQAEALVDDIPRRCCTTTTASPCARAAWRWCTSQINGQSERDLLTMESIAIPLSFVVLVWVFGGLIAAALPLAVGGFAIVGSMAVLRLITLVTDVSIFALNLTTAMGLALAIDYTLLIISRFRDELADGADRDRRWCARWRPRAAPCCSPR